jgi:hypothetical protein
VYQHCSSVGYRCCPAGPLRPPGRAGGLLPVAAAVGHKRSLIGYLRAHLNRLTAGDYLAILAYLEVSGVHEEQLQTLRHTVRDAKRVATCLGFGPRFLHSTGQAYTGGPNTGVFLQITCDDAVDLPVPGQNYTFGAVKAVQARGTFRCSWNEEGGRCESTWVRMSKPDWRHSEWPLARR